MLVYKNIYFVPSFLYIPHVSWYMRLCLCVIPNFWAHTRLLFFVCLFLTKVHSKFCHMYQKMAFPYKLYAHFSAGVSFQRWGQLVGDSMNNTLLKQTKHLWTSLKSYKCNNLCVLCGFSLIFLALAWFQKSLGKFTRKVVAKW